MVGKNKNNMQEQRIKCPYHTPSADSDLSIDLDNGRWVCHICGKSGDDITKLEADLGRIQPNRLRSHKEYN